MLTVKAVGLGRPARAVLCQPRPVSRTPHARLLSVLSYLPKLQASIPPYLGSIRQLVNDFEVSVCIRVPAFEQH